MLFNMETLEAPNRYKILTATVTPRPIAWVTTMSEDGVVNAAPYSFFNALGNEPPTLAIGLLSAPGRFKDTAANILATGEFVVNLVSEANAAAMNITCIDAPPEVDDAAEKAWRLARRQGQIPARGRQRQGDQHQVARRFQQQLELEAGHVAEQSLGRVVVRAAHARYPGRTMHDCSEARAVEGSSRPIALPN